MNRVDGVLHGAGKPGALPSLYGRGGMGAGAPMAARRAVR